MFLNLDFKNNNKIIDTHCHLDDESYFDDLHEILTHAFKNSVKSIIIPAANPQTLARAIEISYKYENVFFAVGVHPNECDKFDIDLLKNHILDEKCVAVGECGLDYYYLKNEDLDIKNKQKKIFIEQLELASIYNKPVIIHSRDANEDTYNILKQHSQILKKGGVLHCFNASELLLGLKDDNFYFGIGGVLTFKNAKNLAQILPKIPKDRILIETDAPYLAPDPYRGKRNEPILTHLIAQKMAEVLDTNIQTIINISTNNAKNLFFKAM